MGMEQDGQLSAYRERLLDSLRDSPERRRRERPDLLRVFVNQECVGTLTWGGASSTSVLTSRGRPVHAVEVRTSTGVLVGGLCAETTGARRAEFPVAGRRLEVSVENRSEGGAVRVAYSAAPPVPRWVESMLTALLPTPAAWRRAAALGQAVLVVSVVLLVADRLVERWELKETVARFMTIAETNGVKLAAAEHALTRQEKALTGLGQTAKTQKQRLTRIQRAVDSLAQEQQQLSASVETKVSAELMRAAADRDQMRGQIQGLMASTGAMGKDIAVLEARAQVAEIRQESHVRPFMFWVSFQDGTSEESIATLIREIHGRTGQINAGWYNVEVSLPQPQTPDSFVESLKKAKIVKAVTTKLSP